MFDLRSFLNEERGAAVPIVALLLFVLCGASALAVDYTLAVAVQSQLQAAAEAGALAAATEIDNETEADALAMQYATDNMESSVLTAADVQIGAYDDATATFTVGASPMDAVRVTTRKSAANGNAQPTIFGNVLGVHTLDITAYAIATAEAGAACIIALHPSADKALEANSNAVIETSNCEINVNSSSNDGFHMNSNAEIVGESCVVGGYTQGSNSTSAPAPETGCSTVTDPYASLAAPATAGCTYNGYTADSVTVTINPGRYCDGLTIKNNAVVTMNPGIYVMKTKGFEVDSNATVTGNDVMIYLHGTAPKVNIDSNSQVTLSAPGSGTYANILFFASHANTQDHEFDSNSNDTLDGVLYFPNSNLIFNSNAQIGSTSGCTQLVASKIKFDSNAGIALNADYSNCPNVNGGGTPQITLVH